MVDKKGATIGFLRGVGYGGTKKRLVPKGDEPDWSLYVGQEGEILLDRLYMDNPIFAAAFNGVIENPDDTSFSFGN